MIPEKLFDLVGKKATIVTFNSFGFPISTQCVLTKVYHANYAQHRDIPHLILKPKGKRKEVVIRVYYYTDIAVYAGHLDINTSTKKVIQSTDEVTVTSLGRCFDTSNFNKIVESIQAEPVFIFLKK